ncbi:3-hydroxyanthranilate 3,4-dioxygenase [Wenjunlia tyrosinilytica]|uniref:3-hydroxyanthranilate 3,4-dioxygenase n=1 Tax=Wenjunlia tyrosinilytica TaxID=1544741 RepID=A0A918E217_9ACTN|nr:3-hydroxyanthranilate 3,4-dioxygenase [Wenjunlia tyrosinilytica]GGO99482.1 3-hydroxyanthranilate 3,4-dioxygenase [Wenjunlia tyrosinilytica]
MAVPPVFNFDQWVSEHEHLLKPPVNNKQMWDGTGDFIVQVVGGPNQRTDFHVDPYEELFYQVKGNMHVNIMTADGPERIDIREGDMWLLPRDTPHSPQRPEPGSIAIVVERIREEGRMEKFQWYCLECHSLLYELELQVRDIVSDLPPAFEKFYASETARTCAACGALHPGKSAL